MPTKKQPNKTTNAGAKAPATAAVKAAQKNWGAGSPQPDNSPQGGSNAPVNDERAQSIAELVRGGMSYSEAKAAIDNDRPAAAPVAVKINVGKDPGADEVIDEDSIPDPGEDLEVVDVEHTPRDGYTMFETLNLMYSELGKSRKKRRFRVSVDLDQRLFDWLLYATIQEANFRKRENLTIEDYIEIKIKELKAADPTAGGRRDPSTSGPRDNFNGNTGKWDR